MNDVQTTEAQVLGLNNNWLDTTTGGELVAGDCTTWQATDNWETVQYWTYPIYGNTVSTTYSWRSKIRLKLSEVLYLRKQARRDKKLKKILQKFGEHIEIEVDF